MAIIQEDAERDRVTRCLDRMFDGAVRAPAMPARRGSLLGFADRFGLRLCRDGDTHSPPPGFCRR